MGLGIYNRALPGRPPNWWMAYAVTEELRVRYALKECTVREPTKQRDQRAAKAVLAQRRREVKAGTWRPTRHGSGSSMTLASYALKWSSARAAAGVKSSHKEAERLRGHVLPVLGDRPIGEVRRADVKELVTKLREHVSARTGRKLSPRMVRHIYSDLRLLYADALEEEIVVATPCTLRERRQELPAKRDADPRFRALATFTADEIVRLVSDERIIPQRRVLYGLTFLGFLRIGEAVARKWRDLDEQAQPLARLHVHDQHDGEPLKTEDPREVPVHPALLDLLRWWRGQYELVYARKPTPDALIVAKLKGFPGPITDRRAWQNLQRDLATLGLRPRRIHDLRRASISIAVGGGADAYLLGFVTHGRPKSKAFDAYVTPPWNSLCRQVQRLRIAMPPFCASTELGKVEA